MLGVFGQESATDLRFQIRYQIQPKLSGAGTNQWRRPECIAVPGRETIQRVTDKWSHGI